MASTESLFTEMPTLPDVPPLPQTAAQLLVGLLRSQLFAESLFGQVFEQSRPYFAHPADEYAATLVQKKVLTSWQATELLAGRTSFYAGTFRLLQRLTATPDATHFVAEQPGSQRLVMLQMTRAGHTGTITSDVANPDVVPLPKSPPPPPIVRCVEVQQTSELRLESYEFIEARPLSELLAMQPISPPHAAHLTRQFASALAVLRDEVIEMIGLPAVWIDSQGQVKLLAGPTPLVNASSPGQRSAERETLQLAAVMRFAVALGGLPKLNECRFMTEVVQCLSAMAQPWRSPFESASLLCPRVRMNRHLRRGPSLRLIESFGEELQFVLDGPGGAEASSPRVEEQHAETDAETVTASPAVPPAEEVAPVVPTPPTVRSRSRRRAFVVSVLLLLIVAALLATQWAERWGVRPAKATTTESQTPPHQNADPARSAP